LLESQDIPEGLALNLRKGSPATNLTATINASNLLLLQKRIDHTRERQLITDSSSEAGWVVPVDIISFRLFLLFSLRRSREGRGVLCYLQG
jgi:hypothetical protein